MYCNNCGQRIKDTSRYCKYCGDKVVIVLQPENNGKRKILIAIITIIVVLFIFIVIAISFFLLKLSSKQSKIENSKSNSLAETTILSIDNDDSGDKKNEDFSSEAEEVIGTDWTRVTTKATTEAPITTKESLDNGWTREIKYYIEDAYSLLNSIINEEHISFYDAGETIYEDKEVYEITVYYVNHDSPINEAQGFYYVAKDLSVVWKMDIPTGSYFRIY